MRRILPLLFLTLAGCSNAPVAGFLDSCFPSRAKANPEPQPARYSPGPTCVTDTIRLRPAMVTFQLALDGSVKQLPF